jgi:hypothetical protein
MSHSNVPPGPDARSAFRLGLTTAALAALVGMGFLYWVGELSVAPLVFTLLVGFPIYLVFVASLLSVWLGYDKDATDLRPVYRERNRS